MPLRLSGPLVFRRELEEAVSLYASRAAEKLRQHGLIAQLLQVFITIGRFALL